METLEKLTLEIDPENVLSGKDLRKGMVVNFRGEPHVITGGSYERGNAVSNFWYYKPILENGTLGKEKFGYCNNNYFTKCNDEYEVFYVKKS